MPVTRRKRTEQPAPEAPADAAGLRVSRSRSLASGRHLDLRAHLLRRAEDLFAENDKQRVHIDSLKHWEDRREELLQVLLAALGGLPEDRCDLEPQVHGTIKRDGYTIERLSFQSLPDVHVTANLYLPKRRGRKPGVVLPCGHSDNGKAYTTYQNAAIGLARRGFVVLCYDPVGQGERVEYRSAAGHPAYGIGVYEHTHLGNQCVLAGDNLLRYMVWDSIRAVDLLCSRPEVDPARIGCCGCSGGGTNTLFAAALDERIQAAVPVCYVTDLLSRWRTFMIADAEQNLFGQVAEGLDHAEVCMLIAPRALRIGAAEQDFFPLEGARATVERARRVYDLFGASDHLSLVETPGEHGFSAPMRQAAFEWLCQCLGMTTDESALDYATLDDADLWCTASGSSSELHGRSLYAVQADRACAIIGERNDPSPGDLRNELEHLIRGTRHGDVHAATATRQVGEDTVVEDVLIDLEPDLSARARLIARRDQPPGPGVVWLNGNAFAGVATHAKEVRGLVRRGLVVLVFRPRGTGLSAPPHNHQDEAGGHARRLLGSEALESYNALILGESLLAMRAHDVLTAVDYLATRPEVDSALMWVLAEGRPALWALVAAASTPRVTGLVGISMPASYDAVAIETHYRMHLADMMHGVLARWDIPHLAAAMAPHHCILVNPLDADGRAMPESVAARRFQVVRARYRALGAEDWLTISRHTSRHEAAHAGHAALLEATGRTEPAD